MLFGNCFLSPYSFTSFSRGRHDGRHYRHCRLGRHVLDWHDCHDGLSFSLSKISPLGANLWTFRPCSNSNQKVLNIIKKRIKFFFCDIQYAIND